MSVTKQTVLIIGGGSGGVTVATSLSKSLDPSRYTIQLVTERPFHIHYPGMLRALVTPEGSFDTLSMNPYDKAFKPGKAGEVVVGRVSRLEDGAAYLEDGRKLPYNWLVLASGTKWEGLLSIPTEEAARDKHIADWRARFANAKSVVIIGGGATGIELAGEIQHYLPGKKVTLIHAQDSLLNDAYPAKYRNRVLAKMKAKGVDVILDDRASMPEGEYSTIRTEKGRDIATDLVVPVWGGVPNTSFLSAFDSTILTPKGTVKVLPSLRVPLANGKTNVFAIGDIIEWNQQKSLAKLPPQAAVLEANLISAMAGKEGAKAYNGFMEAIVVTAGPAGGYGFVPLAWGITMGDFLVSRMKSKTLFTEVARGSLNVA